MVFGPLQPTQCSPATLTGKCWSARVPEHSSVLNRCRRAASGRYAVTIQSFFVVPQRHGLLFLIAAKLVTCVGCTFNLNQPALVLADPATRNLSSVLVGPWMFWLANCGPLKNNLFFCVNFSSTPVSLPIVQYLYMYLIK